MSNNRAEREPYIHIYSKYRLCVIFILFSFDYCCLSTVLFFSIIFFLRGYSMFTNLFILPTIFHSGDHPRINKISHEWTGRSLCGAMETEPVVSEIKWSIFLFSFYFFLYSYLFQPKVEQRCSLDLVDHQWHMISYSFLSISIAPLVILYLFFYRIFYCICVGFDFFH